MKRKRIKFTKKDIGKTVTMYWCGHWNLVEIRGIEPDWCGQGQDVRVHNINLNSWTVIPNDFDPSEIKFMK